MQRLLRNLQIDAECTNNDKEIGGKGQEDWSEIGEVSGGCPVWYFNKEPV